jgi:hypothetical protein
MLRMAYVKPLTRRATGIEVEVSMLGIVAPWAAARATTPPRHIRQLTNSRHQMSKYCSIYPAGSAYSWAVFAPKKCNGPAHNDLLKLARVLFKERAWTG